MPSAITICNLALAGLGDEATISSIDPPEGSAQAEHAARWYPVALDALLEAHPGGWSFATTRTPLALLTEEPVSGWEYAYARPADCVRCLSVHSPDATDDNDPQAYTLEAAADGTVVLYTNQEDAVLRYTRRVTDTNKFTPLFSDALMLLLRSYLAGPVIKGDAGLKAAKTWLDVYGRRVAEARQSDAGQQRVTPKHSPSWMAGR